MIQNTKIKLRRMKKKLIINQSNLLNARATEHTFILGNFLFIYFLAIQIRQ